MGTTTAESLPGSQTQLTSSNLQVHYDAQQELILSCDASPYRVGTVLYHLYSDGSERPIAFASKTLSVAKRKYSQLEKEGLAIVFGVKNLDKNSKLDPTTRPLQHLFNEHRPIPLQASARIQRWALTLSAYDCTISYKQSTSMRLSFHFRLNYCFEYLSLGIDTNLYMYHYLSLALSLRLLNDSKPVSPLTTSLQVLHKTQNPLSSPKIIDSKSYYPPEPPLHTLY